MRDSRPSGRRRCRPGSCVWTGTARCPRPPVRTPSGAVARRAAPPNGLRGARRAGPGRSMVCVATIARHARSSVELSISPVSAWGHGTRYAPTPLAIVRGGVRPARRGASVAPRDTHGGACGFRKRRRTVPAMRGIVQTARSARPCPVGRNLLIFDETREPPARRSDGLMERSSPPSVSSRSPQVARRRPAWSPASR